MIRRGRFVLRTLAIVLVLTGRTIADSTQEPQPGEPINGLQAVLALRNPRILPGEPAPLELELRNVSTSPMSLYRRVSRTLYTPAYAVFHLRRADGTPVHIPQAVDDHPLPPPEAYVKLDPGASRTDSIDLGQYLRGLTQIEPGRYELILAVTFSEEGRLVGVEDAWDGTVLSNAVILEIDASSVGAVE